MSTSPQPGSGTGAVPAIKAGTLEELLKGITFIPLASIFALRLFLSLCFRSQ